MIHTQNDMLDYKVENERCTVVTADAFSEMIDAALESGAKNGVSRKYITGFLCGKTSEEDGHFLQGKIGRILKKKLTTNEYLLANSLYSISKK